jgi:hypothetical protein
MSPALRRLFNPLPRPFLPGRRRGGARPDPFFADPDAVEDDYWRLRRAARD